MKEAWTPGPGELRERPWLLRGALAAALIALTALVLASFDTDDGSVLEASGPRIVTADDVREVAESVDHPVYWAGEMEGRRLQLTTGSDGSVLVGYPAGEGRAPTSAALTIGTYPQADPRAALQGTAATPGAVVRKSGDGRTVIADGPRATSAYFADPSNEVQVEVYDPAPGRSIRLALSDRVQPVQ